MQQPPYGWQQPVAPAPQQRGVSFGDFIAFRFMITPPLATILYLLVVGLLTLACIYSAFSSGGISPVSLIGAIIAWLIGNLFIRVIFEAMLVMFKINDGIQDLVRRR
jgi:hypothetical protein